MKSKTVIEPESYILPSDAGEMKKFIDKFKIDMMENIVSQIQLAIENKLPMVEVFTFANSPFVVTLSKEEFDMNLEHIEKFYSEEEIFELVPHVKEVRQLLK